MWSSPATSTTLSSRMLETSIISFYSRSVYPPTLYVSFPYKPQFIEKNQTCIRSRNLDGNFISCCSSTDTDTHMLPSTTTPTTTTPTKTVVSRKRKRYRKQYPGESKGIVEEMRFVGMKLRSNNNKKGGQGGAEMSEDEEVVTSSSGNDDDDDDDATWQPTTEGFVKYLVDSKLVFETLDRIIDESNHVACGQVIGKQVSDKLLDGRELEFYKWEGDVSEMLKDVRENLNKLGEHWTREQKSRCLKEAAKSFRSSGQLIRLIIL